MKIQKFKYLKNEKSFLDEIKNIFRSFWRAICWWKTKVWWKIADTSFKVVCHGTNSDKNIEKLVHIVILDSPFFHKNEWVLLQRIDFFNIPHGSIDYARNFIFHTREKKD